MYKKSSFILSNPQNLANYVEGYDVYNARFLDLIKDYESEKVDYTITTKNYRPDLIAQELYGDTKYTAFLMVTCALSLTDYVKGNVLKVLPKKVFEKIIAQLS